MKALACLGLVGTLCTFAIIAWMFGETAETLTPHVGGVDAKMDRINDRLNGTTSSQSTLPKPKGAIITLQGIKHALTSYRISNNDIPRASATYNPKPSSNDILRLLYKAGGGPAEKSFAFAGSLVATQRPDENTLANNALSAGENHWAYIEPPRNISSYGSIPLLIEPFRPGETHFRQEDYGRGRDVMVVFSDGTVKSLPINDEGQPVIKNHNIFSSDYPGWKGDTPKVYQPAP